MFIVEDRAITDSWEFFFLKKSTLFSFCIKLKFLFSPTPLQLTPTPAPFILFIHEPRAFEIEQYILPSSAQNLNYVLSVPKVQRCEETLQVPPGGVHWDAKSRQKALYFSKSEVPVAWTLLDLT